MRYRLRLYWPRRWCHYEEQGLWGDAIGLAGGDCPYDEKTIHAPRFIKCSSEPDFSMNEIVERVPLWQNASSKSAQINGIVQKHLDQVSTCAIAMQTMQRHFERLPCQYQILDDMAAGPPECTENAPRRRA